MLYTIKKQVATMDNKKWVISIKYDCLVCKKNFASQRALSVHLTKSTFCIKNIRNNNFPKKQSSNKSAKTDYTCL